MICENCDEEIGEAVTCPICGVIQNITETQVDVFSGFYSKSQRISQPAPLHTETTIPTILQTGPTPSDSVDTIDSKIKGRICELQELLKNIVKILIIKYNVTYRVEVYAKNLWKSFLTRFLTNLNSGMDVTSSPDNSGKVVDETMSLKCLDERLVMEIICKSLNKYRYPMNINELYKLIIYNRLLYINFNKNPNSQPNYLDDTEDCNGLNNSKVDILCRKIMKYLRLPSICLIVLDKLIGCVLEAELNLSDEILSCALVLIVCRLLWPIYHIQPPAHNTTKSTTENRGNISNEKDDVINDSDNRILKYVLEKYREKDMNSFMSSILYRYTNNYYLQFKLSSLKHLFNSHNTTLNLLGFKFPDNSNNSTTNEESDDSVDELIDKLKRGLMTNNEIYYVITSLFRNYPNFSGFSFEKLLEFTHFAFTNHDQKRQTFKSIQKILNTNQYNIYNTVNLNTVLNKGNNTEINKNNANQGVKTNLYEFELNKINNLMGHMDTITEIGYTLPNRPYKLKNKSYSGLPVIYVLTLKVVSNYIGVSQYKVHDNLAGASSGVGLRGKAGTLYEAANALKEVSEAGGASDGGAAENLKNAVGDENGTGLAKALKDLYEKSNATPSELPDLATAVKEKYQDVKGKYEAVQIQNRLGKYGETKGKQQYARVVTAWIAFNNLYKDAPKYDVNTGNILGSRLSLKAEELQTAAKKLENKAQSESVTQLTNPAQQLATDAGQLATNPAQASNYTTNVIDKFDLLETAYNGLGAENDKAKVKKEFDAVKNIYDRILNVSKAKKLKDQVGEKTGNSPDDKKIWHHANELYGKANLLATDGKVSSNNDLLNPVDALKKAIGESESAEGSLQKALKELSGATEDDKIVENALNVIDKYDAVVRAFKSVTAKEDQYKRALTGGPSGEFATKYNPVKSQFGLLKSKYNEAKCKSISLRFDKPVIR